MIHNYSGKSLKELKAEFGTGMGGFYPQSWYDNEPFFTDKLPAGTYEILLDKKALENLTFDEQVKKLEKGYEVPHPAIVVEALLTHFKETSKYLMEDWYTRTSVLDSDGHRVYVGRCDAHGVLVCGRSDAVRGDFLGLSAFRKFNQSLDTGRLEPFDLFEFDLRLKKLEEFQKNIEKIIKL